MSDRNSVWQTLWEIFQSNPFWFAVAALIYRQQRRPWIGNAVRLLRALLTRRDTLIVPPTGSLTMTTAPEPMPPGTASAIVMAMQPHPQPPRFVNNSHNQWLQLDAYQRQHASAVRFAMQTPMPRYNHALTRYYC